MAEIFAFIQARTSSTRLPGKVLRKFTYNPDKTILDHLLERTSKVFPKRKIVLLIPYGDTDLIEYSKSNSWEYVEGPENDVRQRFILAANRYNPKWILRLTADNPFLDIAHIELLVQSTRFTHADLLSFQGLPLGATGEIFTRKSLEDFPEEKLEERHREHVSLHIKEYPNLFQTVKLKSLLTEEDLEISRKIRITIDEDADFSMCQELYESLKIKPLFGTKEIIELYKESTDLFLKNESVNQIKFPLPTYEFKSDKKILILYGNVNEFGSGHLERMKLLYVYLLSLGYNCSLQEYSVHISSDFYLYILDARDSEIPKDLVQKKWICIDNQGASRTTHSYFDSLPHPSISPEKIYDQILLPELDSEDLGVNSKPKVFIYANNLNAQETDKLDLFAVQNFPNTTINRIGGPDTKYKEISVLPRLYKMEFLREIQNSEILVSYFGQSVLEALCLQKKVVLYSISDYHTILAQYLQKFTEVPFLGNIFTTENLVLTKTPSPDRKIQFENKGFEKLIGQILEHLV